MAGRVQGKVAIISGGARGLGGATTRLLAAEGAKVVIADMLDADGQQLAREIGSAALYRHHDVTDEASWQTVVAAAKQQFGHIDILINAAGVVFFGTVVDTPKSEFERILSVNLVGTFLGIKSVGPTMMAQRKGAIINFSSVDGLKGTNAMGAYAASKWGVRGLSKVAAMELGPHGIRVNSIHPGGINTAMGNPGALSGVELNKPYQQQPIQRIGEPEEIARTCLFLASDEASYICGTEIVVDGGMVCGLYQHMLPGAPTG
ncbi:MAG: 3-alpha-hydroxysteroid dehydrogenase [Deltaproteobacteria bacterium]|jgi:3alpha(or 20beta)-hydroxysteroid dehydrogenase|nr:3-alpha-hydroxysteroid dehydrogenase [Deltaproteobacteria bacterium]